MYSMTCIALCKSGELSDDSNVNACCIDEPAYVFTSIVKQPSTGSSYIVALDVKISMHNAGEATGHGVMQRQPI